jgi:hypothetical protein
VVLEIYRCERDNEISWRYECVIDGHTRENCSPLDAETNCLDLRRNIGICESSLIKKAIFNSTIWFRTRRDPPVTPQGISTFLFRYFQALVLSSVEFFVNIVFSLNLSLPRICVELRRERNDVFFQSDSRFRL